MDNLKESLFKEEQKETLKWFKKLPRWLRRLTWGVVILLDVIGALSVIGLATGTLIFNTLVFNILGEHTSIINQNQKVDNGSTVNNYFEASDACPNCSDFKDGKWENIERFHKISDNPLILKSPNSSKLPGAVMFYKKNVKNFSMQTILTPQATTSANLLVQYGNFTKCIIGDANYSFISCRVNTAYGSSKIKEIWSYIDKDGGLHGNAEQHQISSFEPNQDLQLKYEIRDAGPDRIISIRINEKVPVEWKLPKQFAYKDVSDKVGIGLFTTKFDDVQAVLKQFRLDPYP